MHPIGWQANKFRSVSTPPPKLWCVLWKVTDLSRVCVSHRSCSSPRKCVSTFWLVVLLACSIFRWYTDWSAWKERKNFQPYIARASSFREDLLPTSVLLCSLLFSGNFFFLHAVNCFSACEGWGVFGLQLWLRPSARWLPVLCIFSLLFPNILLALKLLPMLLWLSSGSEVRIICASCAHTGLLADEL